MPFDYDARERAPFWDPPSPHKPRRNPGLLDSLAGFSLLISLAALMFIALLAMMK